MKIKNLLFLFIILNSCGVVKVLSVTIPVNKRKYDTPSDINKKLKKYNIETNKSYYLSKTGIDSLSKMPYVINMYKYRRDSTLDSASPLQIRIYDSLGNIYMNWEQCFGPLKKWLIFDDYPPVKTPRFVENNKVNIYNDLRLIDVNEEIKNTIIKEAKQKQYTIFIFYANWLGLYTNEVLREVGKYNKKYGDLIQVVYINTSTYYKKSL